MLSLFPFFIDIQYSFERGKRTRDNILLAVWNVIKARRTAAMAMAKIRAPNRDIMAHKGEQDEQQSYPPQYLYKKWIGV